MSIYFSWNTDGCVNNDLYFKDPVLVLALRL